MSRRLVCVQPGSLWVLDGEQDAEHPENFIYLDNTYESECEEPHPVKIRRDELRSHYAADEIGEAAFQKFIRDRVAYDGGREFLKRTKAGVVAYVSWYCQGGEIHNYSQWQAKVGNEWTEDVYDTFTQALGAFEQALGEPVKLQRRKRLTWQQETQQVLDNAAVTYAPSGRRSWAACGHPAELDIDNHCYTCHGAVAA